MSDDRPSDDYRHIVRLDNVQKYFGAIQALKNINLAIGRNEIVGLIGDNGAGKSTLIKTLTGVMKPTSGRIFIRDREIDLDHIGRNLRAPVDAVQETGRLHGIDLDRVLLPLIQFTTPYILRTYRRIITFPIRISSN